MDSEERLSRRDFLKAAVISVSAVVSAGLSGCESDGPKKRLVVSFTKPTAASAEKEGETTGEEGLEHTGDTAHPSAEHAPAVSSAEALKRLIQGNQRYVANKLLRPHRDAVRRQETFGGQNPFAVILTCSDSRVAPEILFDQGIGDLFVIRTAGNVAGEAALGSIEYAVEHLGVPLVLVLGHQKCGAVTAAVEGGEAGGHVSHILEKIAPAVEKARSLGGDLVSAAIDVNIGEVLAGLKTSEPILKETVEAGHVEILGARYDLDTGVVNFL